MFIVDNALKAVAEQDNPIRVSILGAGFMAQGLTNRIVNTTPGMTVVAVFSRRPERAVEVFRYSGLTDIVEASTQDALEDAIRDYKAVVAADAFLLARSSQRRAGGYNRLRELRRRSYSGSVPIRQRRRPAQRRN